MSDLKLTFDDVLIEPQYSEVESRTQVDTSSILAGDITLDVPIISANMDTVTEFDMALAMDQAGGSGVLHRFMPVEEQVTQIKRFKAAGGKYIGAAIGVKKDCWGRAEYCIEAGVDYLVLDVAHGHSRVVGDTLRALKDKYPDVLIVAGNVCTGDGARYLRGRGADAVKVGVGPSGVCSTRAVAGVGSPQFSAIEECVYAVPKGYPIIADGGIRRPGDMAKAIAAGATSVMAGGILASTREAPGEVVDRDGRLFKQYRGMASSGAMKARRQVEVKHLNGSSPEPRLEHVTPEGVETYLPYSGDSAADIVNQYAGGLRSAMSYSNSLTIEQFHDRVVITRVTQAGHAEGLPHALHGSLN